MYNIVSITDEYLLDMWKSANNDTWKESSMRTFMPTFMLVLKANLSILNTEECKIWSYNFFLLKTEKILRNISYITVGLYKNSNFVTFYKNKYLT